MLVESSKSHIKGVVEGERLLIQCQIRVAKKKKRSVYTLGQTHSGEDNGYGRQIEVHVLRGREGDWTAGGGRREQVS